MRGANPGRCAELWIKSYRECGKASRTATASTHLVARAYLSLNTLPTHSSTHLGIIRVSATGEGVEVYECDASICLDLD